MIDAKLTGNDEDSTNQFRSRAFKNSLAEQT